LKALAPFPFEFCAATVGVNNSSHKFPLITLGENQDEDHDLYHMVDFRAQNRMVYINVYCAKKRLACQNPEQSACTIQ
jgi:hypothetical protein